MERILRAHDRSIDTVKEKVSVVQETMNGNGASLAIKREIEV